MFEYNRNNLLLCYIITLVISIIGLFCSETFNELFAWFIASGLSVSSISLLSRIE